MAGRRPDPFEAWLLVWYFPYAVLRGILRLLLGRRRRDWVIRRLGLHYGRAYRVRYGDLLMRRDEPHIARLVERVLSDPRAGCFIDVGAYVGNYSLAALRVLGGRPGAVVAAVEPDPLNCRVLRRRLQGLGAVVVEEAVYVADGEWVEFHLGRRGVVDGLSQSGSVAPTLWHVRDGYLSGERVRVRSVRLDSLIRRLGVERVDLVKMDIEGAELHVLTDGSLDLSRVENLVVEVHYRYGSRESAEILRALARRGFRVVPLYPDPRSNRFHLLACRGAPPM